MAERSYRFAFVMDQQVGLRTLSLNWERAAAEAPDVQAAWVPVGYDTDGGFLSRLPGLPSGIKGSLSGVREIKAGLGQTRFDAVLWATWAAKLVPSLVAAMPAFLVMDMTPVQMEAMGDLYGYNRRRAALGAAWKRRATDRLYAAARHFFPWSEWVAASLRQDYGVPAEKITVLSPGVDQGLFRPDPRPRTEENIEGDVVRLLFVGGNFHRKGGDLLLRWARETCILTPWEVHLVTHDAVPETPGVVVHHGIANNSPEMVTLCQQSDLLVLPTRADCYSFAAMEAMSCGLPVIISPLGGIPEIVRDGETGILLNPCDDDTLYRSLAAALDGLVSDSGRRQAMGAASLRRARERFDCRVNLGRVLATMKEAARKEAARCA